MAIAAGDFETAIAISLLNAVKNNYEGARLKRLKGKTAVIGGGNVALDAARTAIRLGSQEVTILYRRTREEMPASVEEIEAAEKEGVKINYLVSPVEVLGSNGKIGALRCTHMELLWADNSGRRIAGPVKGSDFFVQVDNIVTAVGQVPHWASSAKNNGLETTRRGTLAVDPDTLATNMPGVFAGGDVVTGPSDVTEAMATGRKAAISIDRYIQNQDFKEGREAPIKDVVRIDKSKLPSYIPAVPRWQIPCLSQSDRFRTFQEINLGCQEWQAISEAKRCFNCRSCGSCIFERHQMCKDMRSRLVWLR